MEFTVLGFMGESGSGKDLCGQWVVDNQEFCRVALADPLKRFCKTVFGFSDEQLWGPAEFRNQEVIPCAVNETPSGSFTGGYHMYWDEAFENLNRGSFEWVDTLSLPDDEKVDYLPVVVRWFKDCRKRADNGLISARIALQLLGTEYGRHFKDSLWIDTLFDQIVPWVREGLGYDKAIGSTQDFKNHRGIIITDLRFKNELEGTHEKGGYAIKLIRLANEDKKNEAEEAGISGHASETEQRGIPEEEYSYVLRMSEGVEIVDAVLEMMFEQRLWLPEQHD